MKLLHTTNSETRHLPGRSSITHKTLSPQTPLPHKPQTVHETSQLAPSKSIPSTLRQWQNAVINYDSDHLLPSTVVARHLLKIRPRRKRHRVRRGITPRIRRRLDSTRIQRLGRVIQSQREENGRRVVVVAEVGVDGPVEGEGGVVAIEGVVRARVVVDGCRGQARDQLGAEPHALGRTERVAGSVAVVFAQRLVVRVLAPLGGGEEGAEGGDLSLIHI